jgi:lysophospholipase L1-like esterase
MIASGASHAAGLAPDPGVTAGSTHFLREDATWALPPASPITTEGDLIVGNSSGVAARLPLGLPGQIVSPVGSDADWIMPLDRGGWVIPLTTDNDILYRHARTVTALSIGFIGDSITADTPSGGVSGGNTPPQGTAINLSLGGLTVTSLNQGHGGAKSADWLIGSGTGYLTTAMAAFATAGARLVHVMLGTNDSSVAAAVSAATYGANLAAMCATLVSNGYTVVLSYPPYVIPGSQSGAFDATSDTRLVAYQAQINSLVNGQTILQGDTSCYLFFQANQGQLGSPSDGVHPNVTGCLSLETLWAAALNRRVQALANSQVLDRLTLGTNLSITSGVLNAASGGGGGGYAPMVNGDLPGPSPIATVDGQFLMTPLS